MQSAEMVVEAQGNTGAIEAYGITTWKWKPTLGSAGMSQMSFRKLSAHYC
jgi:hypothetical protein